jgi:opacity protein-like surface antigen
MVLVGVCVGVFVGVCVGVSVFVGVGVGGTIVEEQVLFTNEKKISYVPYG